jgi:hypothetical protein
MFSGINWNLNDRNLDIVDIVDVDDIVDIVDSSQFVDIYLIVDASTIT